MGRAVGDGVMRVLDALINKYDGLNLSTVLPKAV